MSGAVPPPSPGAVQGRLYLFHSLERSCKSPKAAVSFVVSVCLSNCPQISTRLLPGPVAIKFDILGGAGGLLRQCVEKIQIR
jgi:hypothetical protein